MTDDVTHDNPAEHDSGRMTDVSDSDLALWLIENAAVLRHHGIGKKFADHCILAALRLRELSADRANDREHLARLRGWKEYDGSAWPAAVSDGLTLTCSDCGELPLFDYRVDDAFWAKHVTGPERLSVVCLPCLNVRCRGAGLEVALLEVQWTGYQHTVVLNPVFRHRYASRSEQKRLSVQRSARAALSATRDEEITQCPNS